ncbi:hypothetical protein TIFTF001_020479 [Ficus carica]|uniref:Uncharacterized protein n=1 Tax=Ficus carica TaxID=3494 RepID=A0AA88A8N4_FICCA|nr:hypothetical protein TIFTF001_020479 [Ficus carica]
MKSVSRCRSSVAIIASQPSRAPGNRMINTQGLPALTLPSRLHQFSVKDSSLTPPSTGIAILRNVDRIEISLAIFFGCFKIETGSSEIVEAPTRDIARQPQDRKNHKESHEKNRALPPATSQIERIFDEGLAFRTIFSCSGMAATAAGTSRVS